MPGPTLGEVVNESAADTARAVMAEMAEKDIGGNDGNEQSGASAAGGDKPDTTEARTAEGADRPRDEHGRFTAKARDGEGDADVAGTAGGAETGASAGSGTDSEGAVPVEDLEPPPEWTAEEQDQFRALAPEARRIVLSRVTAAQEARQAAEALKGRYGSIDALIAPRKDFWARDGLDEAGGIRQLLALSDFAAQRPDEFARWFVQARGLSPQQIWQQQQQQANQFEYADPALAPIQQRLDRFERFLQAQEQERLQAQQQVEHQQMQQLQTELSEFVTAKDDKGRLLHPYYEEVREYMGSLYGAKQARDLKDAYDKACRAHPAVFAKIESARKAQAAQEQARRDREKAATANRAGSSVSGTPGDRARPEPTGDLREDLRREFQEAGMLRA